MSDGSSGDLSNCPFKKVSRGLKHMSFGEEHLKWSNLCDFFSHRGLLFYISFASSLAMAGSISHQEADESDESHRNKTPRSKTITHMRTMVLVYLPTIPGCFSLSKCWDKSTSTMVRIWLGSATGFIGSSAPSLNCERARTLITKTWLSWESWTRMNIVEFPIKNGDFQKLWNKLPEVKEVTHLQK